MNRTTATWALGLLLLFGSQAEATPTMWGIDEQDGSLFSISDYTQLPQGSEGAGWTDYGPLKYDRNGRGLLTNIGAHLESFALEFDGTAWFARNREVDFATPLPDVAEPVLFKYDVDLAVIGGPNVATLVGRIPVPGYSSSRDDNISDLAIDPLSGRLFALYRVNDSGDVYGLLVISKTDGSVTLNLGPLSLGGNQVLSAEDMAFDNAGRLYICDNQTDVLWRVELDAERTAIASISMVDNNQKGGLGITGQFEAEALAYNYETGQFVCYEDQRASFYLQGQTNGGNQWLANAGDLNDVEGIDFRPGMPVIPEPDSLKLAAVGLLFGLGVIGRWKQRRA